MALTAALAPVQVDGSIKRIAATDAAQAFADLRDEGAGWLAEQHRDALWLPAIVKVWDGTLDKKICPTCGDLDGTWRPTDTWGGLGSGMFRLAPFTNMTPEEVSEATRIRDAIARTVNPLTTCPLRERRTVPCRRCSTNFHRHRRNTLILDCQ
jgi:hypothetical protein